MLCFKNRSLPCRQMLVVGLSLMCCGSASAATWFVKPVASGTGLGNSWANASNNPQTMITGATAGDQIWIGAGVYKPTVEVVSGVTRSKAFSLRKGISLYGGFQGITSETLLSQRNPALYVTTLSGDLNGDDTANFGNRSDNSFHVVWAKSPNVAEEISDTTKLDGFLIRGGNGNGTSLETDNEGGGLQIVSASPVIQNVVFIDNQAVLGGAAH